MIRAILAAVIALALIGCAAVSNVRDYATLTVYQMQRKQLVFIPVPCAQMHPSKPAIVVEWVREKDRNRMLVVCDEKCNCRLTTQPTKGTSSK